MEELINELDIFVNVKAILSAQIKDIENKRNELAKERNTKKAQNKIKNDEEVWSEVNCLGKQISDLGNQSQWFQNQINSKLLNVRELSFVEIDNLIAESVRKSRIISEQIEENRDNLDPEEIYELTESINEIGQEMARIMFAKRLIKHNQIIDVINLFSATETEESQEQDEQIDEILESQKIENTNENEQVQLINEELKPIEEIAIDPVLTDYYNNINEITKNLEKEIDEEIKKLQDKFADLIVKEDGIIEDGNTAVIDFKGTVDGQALEGGSAENYSLEIGTHSFIPGFEEGLVGHKTGDIVTLNLKFPEDYVENLKGKDVVFEVKVNEVKVRVLPEINEEFFKDLGYNDVKTKEELENKVKEELQKEEQAKLDDIHLDKVLDKAMENMKIELNEEIVDDEIHRMIHEYERQLKMQGLDMNKYFELTGDTEEGLHKKMEGEATKRVKCRYLIEEVAKKENIDFTKEEVDAKAKEMAENYGITVDELIKAYGTIDVVKYDMTMHKALEIIKENN